MFNSKQWFVLGLILLSIAVVVGAFIMRPQPTAEQLEAQRLLAAQEAKIEADELAARRAYQLELEKAKTPEVKAAEIQAQAANDVAGTAAMTVLGGILLHNVLK